MSEVRPVRLGRPLGSGSTYPFLAKLRTGERYEFRPTAMVKIRNAVWSYAKRSGRKFTVRKTDEGAYVERIR